VSHHWMPGFDLRVHNARSVVDIVAVGEVFLSTLAFPSLLTMFRNSTSFTYHQFHTVTATASVVKQNTLNIFWTRWYTHKVLDF
jgi:hypothetical protein